MNAKITVLVCTGNDILNYIKEQKKYAPEVPEQTVIDSWPQLQRKPTLNADEQKYSDCYVEISGFAP